MAAYPPALSRPSWRGRSNVDAMTIAAIEAAEQRAGFRFTVTQGSYQGGGGDINSAGTHDGGGVVDLSTRGLSSAQKRAMVGALREVGFAAWLRTPAQGPWVEHVHAVLGGHPKLAPAAARQWTSYTRRRDGLKGNGPDDGPRLDPIPTFTYPPREDIDVNIKDLAAAVWDHRFGPNNNPARVTLTQAWARAGQARQNAAAAARAAGEAREVARAAVDAVGQLATLIGDTKLTPAARAKLAADIAAKVAAEVARLDAEALAARLTITVDDEETGK